MPNTNQENEIKILDIDVQKLQQAIEQLGAKKVFDANRVFTTFDTTDRKYTKENTIIRLTEEEKLKLSVSNFPDGVKKDTVKLFVSRKVEALDLFKKLGIHPICEVRSHRISYELGPVDIDIDEFPGIPPFVEIDMAELTIPIEKFLEQLGISNKEQFFAGTEDIYTRYGKNYFELFKIN